MGRHHHHDAQRGPGHEARGPQEFMSRRSRGGFGPGPGFGGAFSGPPPWLAEMFGAGRGRGGFAGPGGPGGRGRGPRVRRGDVRAAILDVLAEDRGDNATALNGYAVIQRIAERTDGVWKPSPGSVYPTIAQLEDEELVEQTEGGGRKALTLTDAGRAYVAEHPEEMAAVWAPFAEDAEGNDGGDLKKVIGQTMAAVWQVASTGTAAQVEEAAGVLAETRRKLYTILAEGDSSTQDES